MNLVRERDIYIERGVGERERGGLSISIQVVIINIYCLSLVKKIIFVTCAVYLTNRDTSK